MLHPCLAFLTGRWKFNLLRNLREIATEKSCLPYVFFTGHQGWYFKVGATVDRKQLLY